VNKMDLFHTGGDRWHHISMETEQGSQPSHVRAWDRKDGEPFLQPGLSGRFGRYEGRTHREAWRRERVRFGRWGRYRGQAKNSDCIIRTRGRQWPLVAIMLQRLPAHKGLRMEPACRGSNPLQAKPGGLGKNEGPGRRGDWFPNS